MTHSVRSVLGLFDLVGQQAAVGRLSNLIGSGRLPHALLFEGPEGVGKFTAAMALARGLFCRTPPRPGQYCGECSACVKTETGSHGDLSILTTEKTRIGIKEVRDRERALVLRPVEGDRKILLVEDADRLTIPAQNALLKTLEEPPGSAHIILTTARMRNVLPTIISRCQRVRFAPLTAPQILELLGIEGAEAGMVAALAQGSIGRAKALELDTLREARERVAALDRSLGTPSPEAGIAAIEAAAELGSDRKAMSATLDLMLVWLRDQMLMASGAADQVANVDQRGQLEQLASHRGLTDVLRRARTVIEARRQLELPFNLNATMIAEQMCLALAGHAELKPVPLW